MQWPMVNSLFLATVIRTGFVVVSYGCKVPAGIFVPSMAIGATFGRMIGIMVKAMYRCTLFLLLLRYTLTLMSSVHIRTLASLRFVTQISPVLRQARMHSSVRPLLSGESVHRIIFQSFIGCLAVSCESPLQL